MCGDMLRTGPLTLRICRWSAELGKDQNKFKMKQKKGPYTYIHIYTCIYIYQINRIQICNVNMRKYSMQRQMDEKRFGFLFNLISAPLRFATKMLNCCRCYF